MRNWEDIKYRRIASVKKTGANLNIQFENGDNKVITLSSLLPNATSKDFDIAEVSTNGLEIIIQIKNERYDIPWDKIRVLTDLQFGQFMATQAEENAKNIGSRIKALRERKGMKSSDLAIRAGLTPQTISRIEKGHNDIGFTTLRKILAAMGCTLKDLANIEYDMQTQEKSLSQILTKLNSIGIESSFLLKRIIPQHIAEASNLYSGNPPELLLNEAASFINMVYGWTENQLFSPEPLKVSNSALNNVFLKKPSNSNLNAILAYSHYANYLAKLIMKSASHIKKSEYPTDIDEIKKQIIEEYGSISLEALLSYTWGLGICVLPLNDPGVFHGASWNIEGRHIIILKQNTTSHARYIIDLLHELYHVFVHLSEENSGVVESDEIASFTDNDTVEEREANSFANKMIFGEKAEEIAQKCIGKANWKIENLKTAIAQIAKEENIGADFIANYIAFRLRYQGVNWWGAASNMQKNDPNPYQVTCDFLKKKIKLDYLSPIETNLLQMAINN